MRIGSELLPVLLLVGCSFSGNQPAHAAQQTSADSTDVLVDLIELPRPDVTELREEGTVPGQDAPYSITLSRSQAGVSVRLQFRGRILGSADLTEERFPDLDIRSMDLRAETADGVTSFIISLKFGDERMCYVNDDGRDRIRLNFYDRGDPIFNLMTFSDCEPVHRTIAL